VESGSVESNKPKQEGEAGCVSPCEELDKSMVQFVRIRSLVHDAICVGFHIYPSDTVEDEKCKQSGRISIGLEERNALEYILWRLREFWE
jgi:hypothetical protein